MLAIFKTVGGLGKRNTYFCIWNRSIRFKKI